MSQSTIEFVYNFSFPDGAAKSYTVALDRATLSFRPSAHEAPPAWARLENHQCGHCPLEPAQHPYCPVATNMSSLVEFFKDKASCTEAVVTVVTEERTYVKELPLQRGIFGILGLIMATSPCPYMEFLRPMARFHLPFSSAEETIVRSVSMYLLHQYFVAKRGGQPDLGLEHLEAQYENIQKVNDGMLERIQDVVENDADVNALIILQGFADLLTMAISKDLSKIEPLFFRSKET
ncbi:MAG TPA: hypothetical protein VFE48_12330 [Methylomirabilota bacterium]|nr:hypothetical protein [Methylomirabilota bacterium]